MGYEDVGRLMNSFRHGFAVPPPSKREAYLRFVVIERYEGSLFEGV